MRGRLVAVAVLATVAGGIGSVVAAVRDSSGGSETPKEKVVFFTGLGAAGLADADRYATWELVADPSGTDWNGHHYDPFTTAGEPRCQTGEADDFPADHTRLVGYSVGRLGPVYFLLAARDRWSQIDTIYLLDPGPNGEMVEPGCDSRLPRRPADVLADWLSDSSGNRLVVIAAAATNADNQLGIDTHYLSSVRGSHLASQVYLCDAGDVPHESVVKKFMDFTDEAVGCPPSTHEERLPTEPSVLTVDPTPAQPPLAVEPIPAQPPLAVEPIPAQPPLAVEPIPTQPPLAVEPIPAQPPLPVEPLPTTPPTQPVQTAAPQTAPPPTVPPQTLPPQTAPPTTMTRPTTWVEIAWGIPGSTVPLFSGGPAANVDGAFGPAATIPVGTQIIVDCRTYNQAIATSNNGGWWYHIADGQYAGYWTAASVYENGFGAWPAVGGAWDEAVRVC